MTNIDTVIWDHKIKEEAEKMRALGIKEFTISHTGTSLMEMLEGFERNGYKVAGLTRINTGFKDWVTGKPETAPAILMRAE